MGEAKRRRLAGVDMMTRPGKLANAYFLANARPEPHLGTGDRPVGVVIFRAVTNDGREFIVGKGIGEVKTNSDDVRLTDIGEVVFSRLCEIEGNGTTVRLVEFSNMDRILHRLTETFSAAQTGDRIMLVCRNSKIFDGTSAFLDWQKTDIVGAA